MVASTRGRARADDGEEGGRSGVASEEARRSSLITTSGHGRDDKWAGGRASHSCRRRADVAYACCAGEPPLVLAPKQMFNH